MAGLNYGVGDAFIAMDDDMQTHPSQLKYLLGKNFMRATTLSTAIIRIKSTADSEISAAISIHSLCGFF